MMKARYTLAALMLAGTTAHALPQAYLSNPVNYETAYESIMEHAAADQRAQVVAELPRIGISLDTLPAANVAGYTQGALTLEQLMQGTGYTLAELAPHPPQQPPQDNGAAAAAKAAQQTAARSAGKQAGLDATAASLQQKAAAAQADADHANFTSRITINDQVVKMYEQQNGNRAPYQHDDSGYFALTQNDTQAQKEQNAKTYAENVQAQADSAKAAADQNRTPAATITPTITPVQMTALTPSIPAAKPLADPNAIKSQLKSAAQKAGTAAGRAAKPLADPNAIKSQLKTAAQTADTAAGQGAAQTAAEQVRSTTPAQIVDIKTEQKTAPQTRSNAPADTGSAAACTTCSPAKCDAAIATAHDAQQLARANTGAIIEQGQQIGRLNQNFSALKHQVQQNREEANAGIAGAVAMANIPTARTDERFMLGAGVGTYGGEQALSVGASINVADHVAVKVGVSDSTTNDIAAGAGVGIGF